MNGATELTLDSAGRVLLPKSLLEYAEVGSDLVLACNLEKIEVWSKAKYEEQMNAVSTEDFADLAEDVMGFWEDKGGDDE